MRPPQWLPHQVGELFGAVPRLLQDAKSTTAPGVIRRRAREAIAFDETGTLLVVGSPGLNPACSLPLLCSDSGRAFLYRREADQWRLVTTLLPPAKELGQHFGAAVAAAGNDVLVSAPESDLGMVSGTTGRVYSFEGIGLMVFCDGFETGTTAQWSSSIP